MTVTFSHPFLKNYGQLLLYLLCILAFPGCSLITPSPDDMKLAALPMNPKAVLEQTGVFHRNILKAMANIEVKHGSERYSTKAGLIIKKPSSLRIEAIPIIGPVNFFLSIQEDVLKIFFPQKGIFYVGKATNENLSNVAHFITAEMRVEDLLSLMSGTYPQIDEKTLVLKGVVEEKRYRVDRITEGRRLQSLWVDRANNHLVEVQVFKENGKIAYTAIFEDFNTTEGSIVAPLKITILSGEDEYSRLIIRYSSIQYVTEIESSAFDLQIPPEIEPVYLD
jgi:hypothetical protein